MLNKELTEAINIIKVAGEEVLKIYNSSSLGVEIKEDNSPVTKADKLADKIIREYLSKKFPHYAFLTEESSDDFLRLENDYVWIIDPIDGTKDFIAHDDDFSINIGLSYKKRAVLGVILIPVTGEIYYAVEGEGAYRIDKDGNKTRIHTSDKTKDLIALKSHFHTREDDLAWITKHSDVIKETMVSGSTKKGCLIASGIADVLYRTTHNTKEWDTCAIDIIVREAGGTFTDIDGNPITYNREDVYNRNGYVICNNKENFISLILGEKL